MADDPDAAALELARAAAARLARTDWQLDAEPVEEGPEPEPAVTPVEPPPAPPPPPAVAPTFGRPPPPGEAPPGPDRIIEAMLFAGGPPVTAAAAGAAVRGLTPEAFREAVDRLGRTYRSQRRPYAVRARGDGFVLALRPEFRAVRERLFGGPKEARVTGPALDVLSLVAYRQPVTKAEVDALRGADTGGPLRQLVRLGLAAVARRPAPDGGRPETCYVTTPRFLDLFGLTSLDELPRLAD